MDQLVSAAQKLTRGDKKNPVHIQIQNIIIDHIMSGALKDGERLPTERDFGEALGIARGTIKRVYSDLVRLGYAKTKRSSGTFIHIGANRLVGEDDIVSATDRLLTGLYDLGLPINEVEALLQTRLMENKTGAGVSIAAVDCNPETLEIIRRQLLYLKNMHFKAFLLSEALSFNNAELIFQDFDIIFTTSTHSDLLKQAMPGLTGKILKAVVSTDNETLIRIAALSEPEKVCVLTNSLRFGEIIRNNLAHLGKTVPEANYVLLDDLLETGDYSVLSGKAALILPPFGALDAGSPAGREILSRYQAGLDLIPFNYIIQRGSLIYIEETIADKTSREGVDG